jgi:hypothetical protein
MKEVTPWWLNKGHFLQIEKSRVKEEEWLCMLLNRELQWIGVDAATEKDT